MMKTSTPFCLLKGFMLRLTLVGMTLLWASTVSAQSIRLTIHDATIREVIEKLQKEYGYSFSIRTSEVDVTRKISLSIKDEEIGSVLRKIFPSEQVAFAIDGNIISISAAAPTAPASAVAQATSIHGTVVDELGQPIIGAAVIIAGTTQGTSTGADGSFQIATSRRNVVLQVSYLGMKTAQIPVADTANSVQIKMESAAGVLDDVVVIGYGTQRRSMVTNAVSQFKPDENNMRTALSPSELLQGRVAGVAVSTSSGNLGTAERISIRGSASLNASNEPLYVVDGIPINNESGSLYSFGENLSSLSVLNLTDIESIEILKDAASAAIYGSRATNGVILITTKQGREGHSEVKVNYSFGVSQFGNQNRIKYADSKLWVDVYNEGVNNYNRQNGYMASDASFVNPVRNPFNGLPDTDWLGLITRMGVAHSVDVSFSGGTAKTKAYVAASYNYQEGVVKTNEISKINLKSNVSHKFTKWLEVGANMSGNFMTNHRVPGASLGSTILARAVEQRPFDRPYKPNGDYYVGGTDELSRHNPVQILAEESSYVDNYRFLGAFYAQASITSKLKLKASYSTDAGYTLDYLYYNARHPYKEDNGRVIEKNRFMMTNLIETFANYDNQWGDFTFGAMVGHSFQKSMQRASSVDAQNFPSPSFGMIGSAANVMSVTGGKAESAMESYFGRVSLAYKERYILNATFRTDGSSRFAPDCRWGYFPSVSIGWNVTKESFWNSPKTDLKIRASYGQTGNQDGISDYGWRPMFLAGGNYGGQSGIVVGQRGNPNLTWETADQYDVGFDLSLFGGKINMLFDTYLKNTADLLYLAPLHTTSGEKQMLANIGAMRNFGVEFSLNTHLDLGPVHWSSSLNIAHNQNKLTKLVHNNLIPNGNRALQVGYPIGSFYLLEFNGIYQYDGEVPEAQYAAGFRAGDVKYLDKDGNGIINDGDRSIVGSPTPDFSGGWNNSFTYKGLNLSVFLTYSYGGDVYAQWMTGPTRMGNYQGLLEEWAVNRWTGPGSTNQYPRSVYSYHGNNSMSSTYYLKDGSFIKLKSIMLSYTLPKRWTQAMRMKSVRFFIQGENLALISKYPGWDPEISTSLDPQLIGVDNYGVPTPRIFKAGINITF